MFCTKCGNQIKDGYKFCPKCGTPAYDENKEPQSELMDEAANKTMRPRESSPKEEKDPISSQKSKGKELVLNPCLERDLKTDNLMESVKEGEESAIHELAFRYEMGIGVNKDVDKAKELYLKVYHNNNTCRWALDVGKIMSISNCLYIKKEDVETFVYSNSNYVYLLTLDFAIKLADPRNSKSRETLKDEYVSNMMLLRKRYPEWLYINYSNDITEKEVKALFSRIKENVQGRYNIDCLLCPQFIPVDLEGIKLEIPDVIDAIDELPVYNINYDNNENKKQMINIVVLHSLVLLPIKKIRLTFIDLKSTYEYDLLLRNLPSEIYNERPVTSELLMEEFIGRMEKRREDIMKKYGDYSKYCTRNRSIPVPYEMVILYDEVVDKKYHKRLMSLIEWSKRIGLIIVVPRKIGSHIDDMILAPIKIISPQRDYGLVRDNWKESYGYFCSTGLQSAHVYDKDSAPPLYEFKIEDLTICPPNELIVGEGDFEVLEDNGIYPQIIGCFKTEKEAYKFVDQYCKRNGYPITANEGPKMGLFARIVEECFWSENKATVVIGIMKTQDLSQYYDDLKIYLKQMGVDNNIINRIIGILNDDIQVNGENEIAFTDGSYEFYYWPEYPESEAVEYCNDYINLLNKTAKEKWGEYYRYNHLDVVSYDDFDNHKKTSESDVKIKVVKQKHITLPIIKYNEPKKEGLIYYTPITSNETLLKACFDYIRTEAAAKEEMRVRSLNFGTVAECKYETDLSTMIIPVGKAESKDADFRMDLASHVHSFIIGQSGSGKSVFLHNIIGGAMLKYAPEDLQLYLLDFKLGGVEFNRYQGAKHVKALLVDNSDPQVTLEILRELLRSMTERGKMLQRNGCNKIDEYNKSHQQDRMPHVLVVADECHEMFKADDSIPRQVRNEISDIVIKIAKEGRSQGVHLVFATQTLSGTEISSEIINNVSDFYLLKCAQTDSERLVPNSSAITSELSTGQIYYHHVDEQVKFQAYYTDKESAEKLMAAIVEKAKDHKSNGEFYFNGAQMFYLDESVREQMLSVKGKSPLAFMGKAIEISQKDMYIKLNEDFSENVLLLGLNDQEQVTRTTMNLFVSLMMSAKLKHKDIAFKVIDCLNNEEGEVHELIFDLENEGYCEIIERRQRSEFFIELAQSIQNGMAEETILLILGQDRFRELKMNMDLEGKEENIVSITSNDDNIANISAFLDDDYSLGESQDDDYSKKSSIRTYREALNVILEKGPDYGVHTLLQIEKASNLLFEDLSQREIYSKFKHLILLRSDERSSTSLYLRDDIRLEKLSSDWERLRAYYYAEESDSYTLFTPYMPSKSKDIINLLKTI